MRGVGRRTRWIVGLGSLAIAMAALYLLVGPDLLARPDEPLPERDTPAMDEIDEDSREAMRELLRNVDEE